MSEEPQEQGSKLVSTWADVEKVIQQKAFPKWAGRALGLILAAVLILSVLVGLGYVSLKSYTDHKAQNECVALELLTKTPVPKPANPKANPSRQATYVFYQALVQWEQRDGCTP